MKNKKNIRLFLRSFYLSFVIILCIAIGVVGISKSYENTLSTGFGEYKKAIEYDGNVLRILDFEIKLDIL